MREFDRENRLKPSHYCEDYPHGYLEFLAKFGFAREYIFCFNCSVTTKNARIGVEGLGLGLPILWTGPA